MANKSLHLQTARTSAKLLLVLFPVQQVRVSLAHRQPRQVDLVRPFSHPSKIVLQPGRRSQTLALMQSVLTRPSRTTISGTADSYCACSGSIIAGINTVTSAGKVLEVCAGTPFPVVATLSTSSKPATSAAEPSVNPAIPTTTSARQPTANQVCAGILGVPKGKTPSDIFTCKGLLNGFNQTQFQLFAPAGTPHSTDPVANKNDVSGWGTWQGGGCYCINGNFCCAYEAMVPAVWNKDDAALAGGSEVLDTQKGSNEIDNYKQLFQAGIACTCDG